MVLENKNFKLFVALLYDQPSSFDRHQLVNEVSDSPWADERGVYLVFIGSYFGDLGIFKPNGGQTAHFLENLAVFVVRNKAAS